MREQRKFYKRGQVYISITITRPTNVGANCCGQKYNVNEVKLSITEDESKYKSFDYYSDTFCGVCHQNKLNSFRIKKRF